MTEEETLHEGEPGSFKEKLEDWSSFTEVMERIIKSGEPPIQEVVSAFDEAKVATTPEALKTALDTIRDGLKEYDPTHGELDSHLARGKTFSVLESLGPNNE
jgi:DNA-binding ferritin-like protein